MGQTFCILIPFTCIFDVQSSQTLVWDIIFLFVVTARDVKPPDCTVDQSLSFKFSSQTVHLIKLKIKVKNCENNLISLSMGKLVLTSRYWIRAPFKTSVFSEADIKITSMKYYWQVSHCSQWQPCMYFSSRCAILSLNENLLFQTGCNVLFLVKTKWIVTSLPSFSLPKHTWYNLRVILHR